MLFVCDVNREYVRDFQLQTRLGMVHRLRDIQKRAHRPAADRTNLFLVRRQGVSTDEMDWQLIRHMLFGKQPPVRVWEGWDDLFDESLTLATLNPRPSGNRQDIILARHVVNYFLAHPDGPFLSWTGGEQSPMPFLHSFAVGRKTPGMKRLSETDHLRRIGQSGLGRTPAGVFRRVRGLMRSRCSGFQTTWGTWNHTWSSRPR